MSVPHIVVVGSINMDLVARMGKLPRPGETVHGDDFLTIPGGKGANQAVAAAQLGARVTMIGRVGDDAFGDSLRRSLVDFGVNADLVWSTLNCSSGVALINVDSEGANCIVVIAGANGRLSPADVVNHADAIRSADILIVQLETPLETVASAIREAREAGVRTILDPAPALATPLPEELLTVDIISPNQTEAEMLTGVAVTDLASAEVAARRLHAVGAHNVVLKLGDLGALVYPPDGQPQHVLAAKINVVDTTAAGDAFTAGLAVALAEGGDLVAATRFACAAGSLACTKFGAQPAMPRRQEVDQFLRA